MGGDEIGVFHSNLLGVGPATVQSVLGGVSEGWARL